MDGRARPRPPAALLLPDGAALAGAGRGAAAGAVSRVGNLRGTAGRLRLPATRRSPLLGIPRRTLGLRDSRHGVRRSEPASRGDAARAPHAGGAPPARALRRGARLHQQCRQPLAGRSSRAARVRAGAARRSCRAVPRAVDDQRSAGGGWSRFRRVHSSRADRGTTMKAIRVTTWFIAGYVALVSGGQQAATLQIVSPAADAVISGPTRVEVSVNPPAGARTVNIFVNGRLLCTVDRPPFACPWDPGVVVRGHHVRVVATLADGNRLVGNLHTKDLGYTEKVRSEAVLVPVIVTADGQFVRGLKQTDFEVFEDGVPQRIASMVSESAPLDLVVAIDISGSMESALPEVRPAVKQLLSKLRPGDSATLLGFNDTTFVVAEREKDRRTRDRKSTRLNSSHSQISYAVFC